ncbi:MAG: S8 family serine peptidase, partial [Planctomycetota bacterium]
MPNLDVIVLLEEGIDPPEIPGVVFRSRAGSRATASARITALPDLARHPAVRYVQAPERVHPKNDTATSSSIGVAGDITVGGEMDAYTFSATAGTQAAIRLHDWNDPLSLDCFLEIKTAGGASLASDDDSGTISDSRINWTFASTGNFTIEVSGVGSTTGNYALIIESPSQITTAALTGGDIAGANQPFYLGTAATVPHLSGWNGSGVIVGVIDSGIAWYHEDFVNDTSGESRILFLWDQNRNDGQAPDVGNDGNPANDYGSEYTRADVTTWLTTPPASPWPGWDDGGHGTTVTGAAAGDGSDTDGAEPAGRYQGAAPAADIVFVKYRGFNLDINDAVAYIVQKATALSRPCVINVSLGTDLGSHDGTGAIAAFLTASSGAGRIIVAAAGNEGEDDIHAQATVGVGGTVATGFTVLDETDADIQVWADGLDEYSATVSAPGGGSLTVLSGNSNTATLDGFSITIDNRVGGAHPQNGATYISIDFDSGGAPAPGWSLSLTRTVSGGTGVFDAWISSGGSGGEFTVNVPAGAEAGSVAGTLTDEATSAEAISVGAHATKYRWDVDAGGTVESPMASADFGSIASFSSRGPTRAGAAKPDITGPGLEVCTSLSAEALAAGGADPGYVTLDSRHIHVGRPSFGSPHVAGVVALLPQKNPNLTPAGAKLALANGAHLDGTTGDPVAAPNTWGGGKANAAQSLALVVAPGNTAPNAPTNLRQYNSVDTIILAGDTGNLSMRFRGVLVDPNGDMVKLQIEAVPVGTAFTGAVTGESGFVTNGGTALVSITGLPAGAHHWQARAVDNAGAPLASAWVSFGRNPETATDFLAADVRVEGDGGCSSSIALGPPPFDLLSGPAKALGFLGVLFLLRLILRRSRRRVRVAGATVVVLLAICGSAMADEGGL